MSFLGNLSSSAKPRVYISVTPGVGLEVIQLDFATNSVANYAVRGLMYNDVNRDIADYEGFKAAIQDMFQELNIPPKCEVVLNMPLVLFGLMQFPLLLPDTAITGAIESEVSNSFIFRKDDPEVVWQDVPTPGGAQQGQGNESRQVIYSAMQQNVIAAVTEAITAVGATLVSIENSLTSMLRALDFAGYTHDQMQSNMTWNLLVVNTVGYSIVSMSGKTIVDYYEEPLAFKSFEGDEVYNAINQSAQIALMSYPANYLFIVSDTDQVSASLLASKLQTQSTVTVLENNSFKKQESIIPVGLNVLQSYAPKISLQAVGTALADVSDYPLKLSFGNGSGHSGEESCTFNIGEKEITLTAPAAMKLVGLFAAVTLLPIVLLSFVILPNLMSGDQSKLSNLTTQVESIDKEISQYNSNETTTVFDAKAEIEKGVKNNRAKLMNYIAAGEAIPKSVWLTYFMTQGDGLVDIKGVASDIEDVYVFFKNMRDSLIGTKLKLQKLEMVSSSVDDVISSSSGAQYSFEITNMTTDQLNSFLNTAQNVVKDAAQTVQNAANNNGNSNPPQSGLLSQQPIQGN